MLDTVCMISGTTFEIFPSGLKNSRRTAKDYCVYAGSQGKVDGVWANDIVLPEQDKGVGQTHFMIKYSREGEHGEQGTYLIKDLGEGMGTFIRLSSPLRLQSNFIISFGDSHLVVKVEKKTLLLNFIDGPRIEEKL